MIGNKLSKNHLLETSLAILTLLWFLSHMVNLLTYWPELSQEVPIQSNDTESKWLLWLLPTLAIGLWLFIHRLTRYPERLNYIGLTEENKQVMYAKGRRMSLILKNGGSLSLLFANQAFLHSVVGQSQAIPLTMAIVLSIMTVLYPVYFLVWSAFMQGKK
ncbi:hypothetical protein ACI2JA_13645 [Alkalihalobacillus sp. NPDC078783]